jgi:hypothetical protein
LTKLYAGDLVRVIATGELGTISAEHLGTEPRRFEVVLQPGPKEKQSTTLTCSEDELEPSDEVFLIRRQLPEHPKRAVD